MPKLLARLGLGSVPALTGPACAVCLAGPVLQAPIVAAGLTGVAFVLHYLLWVVAPVNLLPLWLGFRRHHNPWGLRLGALGALLVVLALLVHAPFHLAAGLHDLMWLGVALFIAGGIADWLGHRPRRSMQEIVVRLATPNR